MGLGVLLGPRLMLLEHVGRTSGTARFVVLEVLARPNEDELVVASGFGRGAQWFQNLQHNPNCYVSVGGRRRVPAVAIVLEPERAAEFLVEYQREHPKLWAKLNSSMVELHGGDTEYELPLVRLQLEPSS